MRESEFYLPDTIEETAKRIQALKAGFDPYYKHSDDISVYRKQYTIDLELRALKHHLKILLG